MDILICRSCSLLEHFTSFTTILDCHTSYCFLSFVLLLPPSLSLSLSLSLSVSVSVSHFHSHLLTFCVIYASYKCTCCTHHTHDSLSCLIVHTRSAPIYFPNSSGVVGHRAILTMGGSDRGWGFPHRTNRYVTSTCPLHWLLLILFRAPPIQSSFS